MRLNYFSPIPNKTYWISRCGEPSFEAKYLGERKGSYMFKVQGIVISIQKELVSFREYKHDALPEEIYNK